MENVHNKTAMVTGGGNGIGYCITEELLRNGAKRVAIVDLPIPRSQEAMKTLQEKFGYERVIFFPCDVTKTETLKETFEKIVSALDGLDILVNNAGICDDYSIERTFAVNTLALIHASLMALDHMGKHKHGKGGTIVNIASIAGLIPGFSIPVYTASKHAALGFSRCLKIFYDKTKVRILVMCPHITQTALGKDGKHLDLIDDDIVQKDLKNHTIQSAAHVACATIQLVQKGKNGEIWCVKDNQPAYEIQPYVLE